MCGVEGGELVVVERDCVVLGFLFGLCVTEFFFLFSPRAMM